MRYFVLFLSVLLLAWVAPVKAGFVIKPVHAGQKSLSTLSQGVAKSTTVKSPKRVAALSCFNRVSWVGYATLVAAIAGLFVPAMSIIAILLGIIGMTRGCRADRLATIAMMAGVGELIYFLATNAALLSL